MPVFSEAVLTDHDLDSVIRYLFFQRDRPVGGVNVGRSGPVTEGLVAWFVGLGLMLVMAYFIGERREPDGVTDEVVPSIEEEEKDE
jgi:ubiquinol-cytochrome c reductase cytochrome c subunit